MLSNEEIINSYREAKRLGYISNISDMADGSIENSCTSDCDYCPGSAACVQLSVDKDYTKFIENFNRDILPLLEDGE